MEILPSLLSFIDSKVRTFKRKISDVVENPNDVAEQVVDNTISFRDEPWFTDPEVRKKYNNDMDLYVKDNPTAGKPQVTGPVMEQIKDPANFIGGGAGTFISRGAKTWNQSRYLEAIKMKVNGKGRDEIWNKTGTWLDTPDMIPRQEISDLDMMILNPNKWLKSTLPDMQGAYYQQGQLDTLITNPNLSAAYPGLLKDIFSKISKRSGDNKSGKFDSVGGRVFAHASEDEGILKVLAHELQHAVQSKEGFASGGNPDAVIKGDIPEAAAFFDAWRDKLLQAGQTPQNATDKAAYMAYHNLAGEAEARATAARLYYNDADRLARPPWLDYEINVPLKDLILRFNKRTTP